MLDLTPTLCSLLSPVYLLGEPASFLMVRILSTLVGGRLTTAYPLLVLPPFHTPQIKLHYVHRRHQQHQQSSSGTVLPLNNWLLFVVTSKDFATIKIAVNNNSEEAVTVKIGNGLEVANGISSLTEIK
jgi:hypothetical protein